MNTLVAILVGVLLFFIGAFLALGVVGIVFVRRILTRMDEIEKAMKNIKVEIVE